MYFTLQDDVGAPRTDAATARPALALAGGRPGTARGLDDARRLLDIVVASLGLLLTAPLLLLIALVIKATFPGPVFHVQTRIGIDRRQVHARGNGPRGTDLGRRSFRIYKFRTMHVEHRAAQVWAQPGDPHVTPIGRFLRKYRLDELPQLWNVLMGDMSIVGPRPEQPAPDRGAW